MNDHHPLGIAAAKTAVGPGSILAGMLTLNEWAIVFGMACSVAIFIQTVLNIYWRWKDRQNRP